MSITFKTSDPNKLLNTFKKAIDDKHVVTWSYDVQGDFTHTPDQWAYKAWLRPSVGYGELTLNFLGRNDVSLTKELYAVFQGRFIESMLAHCDTLFQDATATALLTGSDRILKIA